MIAREYVTPSLVLWTTAALVAGAVSLGFNPLFSTSIVSLVAGVVALRGTRALVGYRSKGLLQGFAILGVMGGLGGISLVIRLAA